jgi:hypothetical protein
MAVKKSARKSQGDDNTGKSKPKARRTPPKEKAQARGSQNPPEEGKLPVDTGELQLPQDLSEEEDKTTNGFLRFDPVVLFILCFSFVFILVIAYVIWSGWEPPTP